MRTVLNSASRADSERSPLHDVKQHTPPRRTQGKRGSVSLLDERNRLPATGRRLVLSQALTQRLLRQQSLMLEPSRNGCRPEGCRNRRQSCTPNAKPEQPSRRSGGARRDRTDDLLLAKQALSQLSYGPFRDQQSKVSNQKLRRLITDI